MTLYLRDASWHPYSKARSSMPKYHLPNASDEARAACSSRIILIEESAVDSTELTPSEVCERCQKRIITRSTP